MVQGLWNLHCTKKCSVMHWLSSCMVHFSFLSFSSFSLNAPAQQTRHELAALSGRDGEHPHSKRGNKHVTFCHGCTSALWGGHSQKEVALPNHRCLKVTNTETPIHINLVYNGYEIPFNCTFIIETFSYMCFCFFPLPKALKKHQSPEIHWLYFMSYTNKAIINLQGEGGASKCSMKTV